MNNPQEKMSPDQQPVKPSQDTSLRKMNNDNEYTEAEAREFNEAFAPLTDPKKWNLYPDEIPRRDQTAKSSPLNILRSILSERTKGETETWGFVAMFMEMIDEVEKRSTPAVPTPQTGATAQPMTGDLANRIAAAIAHRGCCGSEDDPANGKIHGYCVVCGIEWPCETAQTFMFTNTK